jgi:DNA-binding NtrC family response regulator
MTFGTKKDDFSRNAPHGKQVIDNVKIPPDFKILIIDDDIDFLKALEFRLAMKKINVVAVESGYKALDVLKENYFDLILLDLRMPGMSGTETFKEIKEIERKPFVIIMTAYLEDDQVETVKKLDLFGFLQKPFDFDKLMPYIEKRIKYKLKGH